MPEIIETAVKDEIRLILDFSQYLLVNYGIPYTQRDIAEYCGVSPSTVSRIKKLKDYDALHTRRARKVRERHSSGRDSPVVTRSSAKPQPPRQPVKVKTPEEIRAMKRDPHCPVFSNRLVADFFGCSTSTVSRIARDPNIRTACEKRGGICGRRRALADRTSGVVKREPLGSREQGPAWTAGRIKSENPAMK